MLLHKILENKSIILGSASPRRRVLLEGTALKFTVDTENTFIEKYPQDMVLNKIPEYLAKGKSYGFHRQLAENEILITADTMVFCNGMAIGKPKSREDAMATLQKLQDNCHTVLTGVCIRNNRKFRSFTVSSNVFFGKITDEELNYYLDTFKPYDKAGAYGIQEWIGFIGIEKIEGSYFNVMGLPVQRLYKELKEFAAEE